MQLLENFDIFGKPVLFNFGKNEKSKSRLGALVTLCFVGFAVWITYYFGKEIFEKKSPNVTLSQSFEENPGEMQVFTNDTFVLNFGIQNKQTVKPFMNASIFTFQAYLYYTKRVPQDDGSTILESENIPLDLESCSKSYFGELGNSFSYYDLSSMYCLSKEQLNLKKGLSILGKPESPVFQSIQVAGYLCDPSTSAVPCGTQQEIEDALGFFTLQYSKVAVDPMNYEKPVKKFRDAYFTSTMPDSTKEVDLWVSPLEMKTDDGWFTNSYTTEKYVQFSKVSESTSQKGEKDPFFYIFLMADGVTTQYARSYAKVQDVAAQVNGIISFVLIGLILLVTPYVRLKFYEELIHDLFDVKIFEDHKGKMLKRGNTMMALESEKPLGSDHALTKQTTLATKNGLLTGEEDGSPQKEDAVKLEIMESKKEENTAIFSQNLLLSPRDPSEEQAKVKIPKKEDPPVPRRKRTTKKSVYGSPTLSETKPERTKPTFKALMENNNDTHDVFEEILLEMAAVNQQQQQEIPPSTERGSLFKTDEGAQTQREQERPDNPKAKAQPLRKSPSMYLRSSDRIDLTFWEYLRSFFSKTEAIKEKMEILNEGIRRINERLDIFNLLKKLREVDKLKILLLEDDQYILFEGLPKPEIRRESGIIASQNSIKSAKFIQEKVKNDLIYASYKNLKSREEENLIDKKLLKLFDDIFVE